MKKEFEINLPCFSLTEAFLKAWNSAKENYYNPKVRLNFIEAKGYGRDEIDSFSFNFYIEGEPR